MSFDLERCIEILERTPATLRSMLTGLDEAWIRANEGEGTWSAFDVVGHLIDGEERDWIPRTRQLLEHGEAVPFEPFDRFRHLRVNGGRSIHELLDRFAELRASNLDLLRGLELEAPALQRCGTHPEFGAVRLEQMLSTWTVHDLGHVAQIARVMAKRWKHEVGPWAQYLPIVH